MYIDVTDREVDESMLFSKSLQEAGYQRPWRVVAVPEFEDYVPARFLDKFINKLIKSRIKPGKNIGIAQVVLRCKEPLRSLLVPALWKAGLYPVKMETEVVWTANGFRAEFVGFEQVGTRFEKKAPARKKPRRRKKKAS